VQLLTVVITIFISGHKMMSDLKDTNAYMREIEYLYGHEIKEQRHL